MEIFTKYIYDFIATEIKQSPHNGLVAYLQNILEEYVYLQSILISV